MKTLLISLRILLGLVLLVFGINGLFQLFPLPETTLEAASFQNSLWKTGYLMQMVKTIEILGGVALLTNRFIPVALLLLAPITLNILLVDMILQPQYGLIGYLVFGINAVLIYQYRSTYRVLLTPSI